MRPIDSSYDQTFARGTTALLDALRQAGRTVETPVTGAVIVDGREIDPQEWDGLVAAWSGDPEDLDLLGR